MPSVHPVLQHRAGLAQLGTEPPTTTAWVVGVGWLSTQQGQGSSVSAEDPQPSHNVLKENKMWNKCSFMILQEIGYRFVVHHTATPGVHRQGPFEKQNPPLKSVRSPSAELQKA